MTRLSVNINKIATLRNARGEDYPNLLKTAQDIISFGAQGITIHPRPDQRHIRYSDALELKGKINTELNIEGNPSKKFIDLVNSIKPEQVTLVPDSEDAITSNAGWNTIYNFSFLNDDFDKLEISGHDAIVHCGALTHQINELKREEYVEVNISQTIKLANKAKKNGVQHFIFLSTIKVYGEVSKTPFTEKSKPNPLDFYSKSKLKAENELLKLCN